MLEVSAGASLDNYYYCILLYSKVKNWSGKGLLTQDIMSIHNCLHTAFPIRNIRSSMD
jgi:hypothetical protein